MARPSARSLTRCVTAVSGVASTIRITERERSELSRSSTAMGSRVASPALNTPVSHAISSSGTNTATASRNQRRRSHSTSRPNTSQKPGRSLLRGVMSATPIVPGDDGAHAGTQSVDRLLRYRADFECPQVEVSGGAGGAPRRVLSLNVDHRHANRNRSGLKRRNHHFEGVTDLQAAQKVLADVERKPEIAEVDHRKQRCTGTEILAELRDTGGDLSRSRRADRKLVHIDVALVQRGFGLLRLGRRQVTFFLARTFDREL